MITAMYYIAAVSFMVAGHIFKVKRWGLLISVYEEPPQANLLQAMAFGHTLNTIFPFRVGDVVRVLWAGRVMKNGVSFSLATSASDLYIDLLTVSGMFFCCSLIGRGGEELLRTSALYMKIFLIVIPLTTLCVIFRKAIKKAVKVIAGIFNEKIEFWIMYVIYLCIASMKDIIKNISKAKFIFYTFGIWSSYVASYVVFAETVQRCGIFYSASNIFTKLFSGASLYSIDRRIVLLWGGYLLLPLGVCWISSTFQARKGALEKKISRATLPQMNQADRLAFLKTYYEEENREFIQVYLQINKDVTVIEDNSAGSNASTILVMKENGTLFFRKYAFDGDGDKLQDQIDWIEDHQKDIPLPVITNKRREGNYVSYDMHSYGSAMGLFRYIHTRPVSASWQILLSALRDIQFGLHTRNAVKADMVSIEKYIADKVEKNLAVITENDKFIKALEQYDTLMVNGQVVRTLRYYRTMFEKNHLLQIFSNDLYADIHGDLTIENIICLSDQSDINDIEYIGKVRPMTYYFIDPNTGNVHNSPFLDYGKLLQSLHGNYEFLMMVSSVNIDKNRIDFLVTKSESYEKIYEKYKAYLMERFSPREVLSIYYHEVIHWLRLMPYKIKKNEKMAVVFYTGLLIVLNDVWELEHEREKKTGHLRP